MNDIDKYFRYVDNSKKKSESRYDSEEDLENQRLITMKYKLSRHANENSYDQQNTSESEEIFNTFEERESELSYKLKKAFNVFSMVILILLILIILASIFLHNSLEIYFNPKIPQFKVHKLYVVVLFLALEVTLSTSLYIFLRTTEKPKDQMLLDYDSPRRKFTGNKERIQISEIYSHLFYMSNIFFFSFLFTYFFHFCKLSGIHFLFGTLSYFCYLTLFLKLKASKFKTENLTSRIGLVENISILTAISLCLWICSFFLFAENHQKSILSTFYEPLAFIFHLILFFIVVLILSYLSDISFVIIIFVFQSGIVVYNQTMYSTSGGFILGFTIMTGICILWSFGYKIFNRQRKRENLYEKLDESYIMSKKSLYE